MKAASLRAGRRTADQTRQLLMDVALGMLHERGPAAGVTHVRLTDVLDRAGLTTGAAYRLWTDQRAFHDELAIKAVRWRDRDSTEKTARQVLPIIAGGGPWQEVLRIGAEANLQSFPADIALLTTMALRASAYGQPALLAASHERHREAMTAYGQLYQVVLDAYGRRMKPPFTLDHLCSLFAALSEGFGLQAAAGERPGVVQIQSADPRIGETWTLLGVAAVALIEHLTEVIGHSQTGQG